MNLNKSEFIEKYKKGENFYYFTQIPSDLFTPVSTIIKLAKLSEYHVLFESVTGGEKKGRYSIIALDPNIIWKCEDKIAKISYDDKNFVNDAEGKEVFNSLRKLQQASKITPDSVLPSMAGGLFGYVGYDMVRLMEKLPEKNKANLDIADSIFFRPQIVLVFDNIKDVIFVSHPIYHNKNISAEAAYDKASKKLDEIIVQINSCEAQQPKEPAQHSVKFKNHIEQKEYHEMVEKAKEYIVAGDIFQIVPSRRFSSPFTLSPISFYRSLRSLNPSPYLFYLNLKDFNIIGSSPEILVKLKDKKVTIRPIAGTRKRGVNEAEDVALEQDLISDKKEIAEHLMLLDLGRNDVGRCAKFSSVKVTEKMTIERYSHVMHIVSNVEGEIAEGKDFIDALIAGFPAGTVSGAPKIRAMQIIEELEKERRQFYAGAVGYISNTGDMDVAIALRTALIKDNMLYLQSGGGVVFDSTPEGEYQETQNKAMALMKAAENAKNYV